MPRVVAVLTRQARVAVEGCSQARSKKAGGRLKRVAVLAMFRRSVGETTRAREVRWIWQIQGRRCRLEHPDGRRGLLLGRISSASDRASFLDLVMGASTTLRRMRRIASLQAPAAATRVGTRAHVVG